MRWLGVGRGGFYLSAVLFALTFAGTTPAMSYDRNFTAVDAGVFVSNLVERLGRSGAYSGQVSQLAAILRVRRGLSLGSGWYFEPSFATLLPWRSSSDGNAKTFTSFIGLDLTFGVLRPLRFRLGPGVEWQLTASSGDTVYLNNGGATKTSPFYSPGGMSNVFLFTAQGGIELDLSSVVSLHGEMVVINIASRLRRGYHGLMALGVRW